MFNDLSNDDKQTQTSGINNSMLAQSPGQSNVDDIFAETDRVNEKESSLETTDSNSSNIDTKKVGLAVDDFSEKANGISSSNKWFKISLVSIILVIVILVIYLIFVKFFSGQAVENNVNNSRPNINVTNTKATRRVKAEQQNSTSTTKTESSLGSFVIPSGDKTNTTTSPAIGNNTSNMHENNVRASSSNNKIKSASDSNKVVPAVDSDKDGLSDSEEISAKTNINVIDTDNDGLSDYEEVKIYHTNPLSADTDGDGYLDGAEVKSGYNPNGSGKLSK